MCMEHFDSELKLRCFEFENNDLSLVWGDSPLTTEDQETTTYSDWKIFLWLRVTVLFVPCISLSPDTKQSPLFCLVDSVPNSLEFYRLGALGWEGECKGLFQVASLPNAAQEKSALLPTFFGWEPVSLLSVWFSCFRSGTSCPPVPAGSLVRSPWARGRGEPAVVHVPSLLSRFPLGHLPTHVPWGVWDPCSPWILGWLHFPLP